MKRKATSNKTALA